MKNEPGLYSFSDDTIITTAECSYKMALVEIHQEDTAAEIQAEATNSYRHVDSKRRRTNTQIQRACENGAVSGEEGVFFFVGGGGGGVPFLSDGGCFLVFFITACS